MSQSKYKPNPPYEAMTYSNSDLVFIVDGDRERILVDVCRSQDTADDNKARMQWIAQALTDCAQSELTGDNLTKAENDILTEIKTILDTCGVDPDCDDNYHTRNWSPKDFSEALRRETLNGKHWAWRERRLRSLIQRCENKPG